MRTTRRLAALILALSAFWAGTPVLGQSNADPSAVPTTDCAAAAISAAITAGGTVNIVCPAETVITFASEQVISHNTTINGNGNVIFDGQNARRLLRTNNNIRLTLRNLTIRNGLTADQGGGLLAGFWNILTISNVVFQNNRATRDSAQCDGGGAIFIGGGSTAVITGSSFLGNQANNGGAINSLRTSLAVYGSAFSGNQAIHTDRINGFGDCGGGGAIYIDGGRNPESGGPDGLILRDNDFTANTTNNHGGAIFAGLYTGDTLTVDGSEFDGNSVTKSPTMGSSGTGGAIWYGYAAGGVSNERLVLTNSTLANNKAISQGGGLWTDAPATLANVTFAGNDATDPTNYPPDDEWRKGNGGALAVASNAPVDINNATFAWNHAGFNGGAIAAGNTVAIKNTLFYNNHTDWSIKIMQHCTSALTDLGNNLQYPPKNPNPNYWNETNCTAAMNTANPAPADLADNGGPARTMALPAGSPALNQGNPLTCVGLDQRGYTRSGICDIGAYERGGAPFAPDQRSWHSWIGR